MREFATVAMDTLVHVTIDSAPRAGLEPAVERAFGWFETVERICSRFDRSSEVMRLSCRVGEPMSVSPLLLELVDFALALARLSDGAFEPTLGADLEAQGYAREYRTGEWIASGLPTRNARWQDVHVDRTSGTIMLQKPLVLDRLNKVPLVLTFLLGYFCAFTAVSFSHPQLVAEMFRPPFLQAALFLAFFMLTDPPTSPNRYLDQVAYGLIAAVGAVAAQVLGAGQVYLLVGTVLANLYLVGVRVWRRQATTSPTEAPRSIPVWPSSSNHVS